MRARQNYAILAAQPCCESKANLSKKVSSPVTGLKCSYGKIFIPVAEISVVETEIKIFTKEKGVRRDHISDTGLI